MNSSNCRRGSLLVTGVDCKVQMGHKDMPVRSGASLGYFIIANGNEEEMLAVRLQRLATAFLVLFPRTRENGRYVKDGSCGLVPNIIFSGHGYLRHAVAEYVGSHSIRYYI